MNTRLWKIIFAILLSLPLCANATTIDFNDNQTGTITYGNVFETVNVWDTATVDMTGGWAYYCNLYDSSTFNFYDGDVGAFSTHQSATVNIFTDDNPDIYVYDQSEIYLFDSGNGSSILIWDNGGAVHIYGYDFEYEPAGGEQYNGMLSGFWPDGRTLYLLIRLTPEPFPENNIILHIIPEPTSFLVFGLGLCGLLRKRNSIFYWGQSPIFSLRLLP